MKSSTQPTTAEAKHFFDGIEGMCRKKRRGDATSEFVDLDCESQEHTKAADKDICTPYYDYGHYNMGEYSDDADSVSDAVTQCSEGKEMPNYYFSADFDNFLSYIAHDRSNCECEKECIPPHGVERL